MMPCSWAVCGETFQWDVDDAVLDERVECMRLSGLLTIK